MHRLLACALLLFGVGVGLSGSAALRRRETLLEQTVTLLRDFRLELDYTCRSLPTLVGVLSERAGADAFELLLTLQQGLQSGEDFPAAMSAAAESVSGYTPAERAHLLRLSSLLGTTDKPGQLTLLQREIDWFAQQKQTAVQKRQKYAALYRAAGVFAGFATFIVLF